ncbi:MAG: tRNA uridine(34) 5-carboxymethylaminomethyl modification radical SAM/GNAT enzyme Elp3 [Candidatus Pacearchaeota archaeon]|nr:tRNA uridine(34) 5-carboxymethylaminomethyl modification radical SAM/GNAT enzyme Elp3 [Candidatus Pacearchaeota archaeon]
MDKINHITMRKPTKTISGVTPVAVVIKPRACVHGTCVFCPTLNVPQSYTPKSPAIMRAMSLGYDPYKQVVARLGAFEAMKHPTDKIELIIMGGTFLSYPEKYQYDFVKSCYDALNEKISKNLEEAKRINETAKHRCVALCIETRPDVCSDKDIKRMLKFGCTRVELGVQAVDDAIYKKNKRGHKVKDVVDATKRLKDAGFKVFYHAMVGLPGSSIKKDIKLFEKLFSDKEFRPDGIKIYPTQVIRGAELEKLYNKGKYSPYTAKELIELLIKLKIKVPEYCRIARIMREIPPDFLVAGTTKIDLRNIIEKEMLKRGLECKCIRCREVGFALRKGKKVDLGSIKLCRKDYKASSGQEIFLSYEDTKNHILIALLRMRIPSKPIIPEINKETAIIRELHTYGPQLLIKTYSKKDWQHKGYGKLLLKEAEKIAKKEFKMKKMIIISGVGVRDYFYKQDYKPDGPYVSKGL